jgi:hypothetical protein
MSWGGVKQQRKLRLYPDAEPKIKTDVRLLEFTSAPRARTRRRRRAARQQSSFVVMPPRIRRTRDATPRARVVASARLLHTPRDARIDR